MEPIDIVFSFDTTGSMYPCLSEVRRQVANTVKSLFNQVTDLHIGIIAHGDYCDERSSYVTKHLPLTADKDRLITFVQTVERTGGGDAPECYELVLHEARTFNWRESAKKLLVVIGDDVPHPPAHNPKRLDWRDEVKALTKQGVLVHGVQCLGRRHADGFYRDIAGLSGGVHVPLNQFADATETLIAITYHQQGGEQLQQYEDSLVKDKRMTRSLEQVFAALQRRDPTTGRYKKAERTVNAGRFQVVRVDNDIPIRDLVDSIGAEFAPGRGFYEFTKRETIQPYKEVILMDNTTGDMYEGAVAREKLGLPHDGTIKITPEFGKEWTVFVQSTSYNRKLKGKTRFLYEAT